MTRVIVVSLNLESITLRGINEFNFDKLKSDIRLLAQQPPVGVAPCYKDKKIDYGIGYRHITVVTREDSYPMPIEFKVRDRASVEGSTNHSDIVGARIYTQQEVDELRDRANIREDIESD